jgi:hypothetical protein
LLSSSDALKDPSVTYDYMSYCMYENVPIWSSPFTYEQIYEKAFQPVAPAESARPLSAAQTYLLAGAVVYKDGTANLEPCWVIRSEAGLIQEPTGTQYCLEAQNAAGTALISHCLDLPFVDTNTGESADADGFSLMLPYPEGVSRIVLKKGAQELAVRHVSAHVPVVTVLSPNGGESWAATGTYTIAWTASDLDAEPLTYRALYSPDGSDWTPIGGTTSETHLTVDTAELAGGDRARVRVLASDGINTGADESDASFVVGQKGPQVYIVSPEGDGSLPSGGPFFLQGYAYDREDRALDEAALRWSSSRDGDLGTGSQVLTSISRGQHTITLTATDSHGNVATASVNIYVGSRVWLPVVLKG